MLASACRSSRYFATGLLLLTTLCWGTPSWAQGSEAQCRLYAGVAVSQVQLASGCPGVSGARWTPNFNDHFNWCRTFSTSQTRNFEYNTRQTALIGCTGRSPRVALRDCIDYGIRAYSQADLAFYKDCGFTGARWSRDWVAHRTWCEGGQSISVTGTASAEDEQRRIALASCMTGANALSADQRAILANHNQHRARHCVEMLGWSPRLATAAAQWARACTRDPANSARFAHSPSGSRAGQGENLAWGSGLSGDAAAALWYNEYDKYNFTTPVYSGEVGHFTQMVWRGTTQIGCGSAVCGGQTLWVCRYSPPGNMNVQPGTFSGFTVTPEMARQNLQNNVSRLCMSRAGAVAEAPDPATMPGLPEPEDGPAPSAPPAPAPVTPPPAPAPTAPPPAATPSPTDILRSK